MVHYDPFADEIVHGDPHPIYKRMRDEAPVYHVERYDCYALSRFADVWEACLDAESYSSARGTTAAHLLTRVQPVTPMLNLMDPPEHTRLRAELRPLFSPARMRQLEPDVRHFVEERFDAFAGRGVVDVVSELAQPLATFVASRVAGFPDADGPTLRELVKRFLHREPGIDSVPPDGLRALEEMLAYFSGLSAERRRRPSGVRDALAVLHAFDGPGTQADEDVASHLALLLVGGTDTLPKAFANLVLRLDEHPEQRAAVAADPSRALDAFHEALRLDMPTQYMCRSVVRDVVIHGVTLPAGRPVLFLYASANRDEREFPAPERYDIARPLVRHLGFGHGTHACLGIHAARLEAVVALQELLARHPRYAVLRDELERYQTEFVKGYSRLPIRLAS
jgi:cytochrome P450